MSEKKVKAEEKRMFVVRIDFDNAGDKTIRVDVPAEIIWKAICEHCDFITFPDFDKVKYIGGHYFKPNR